MGFGAFGDQENASRVGICEVLRTLASMCVRLEVTRRGILNSDSSGKVSRYLQHQVEISHFAVSVTSP